MRVRHKPYAREMIQDHPEWVVPDPDQYQGQWQKYFQNTNPVHLEIGTGKGQFLIEMAQLHPDVNFIGIEVYSDVLVIALQKALKTDLHNLRFLRMNGRDLAQVFGPGELKRIYLNFSDPWPKHRHRKRRLTNECFLKEYKKVLDPEGELDLKTDSQGFFEYSLCTMSQFGMFFTRVDLDLHHSDFEGNVMTEYEEKFSDQGLPIYRLAAQFRQNQVKKRPAH